MKRRFSCSIQVAGICALFVAVPVQLGAQNPFTSSYQYLTAFETTIFGEVIKFWGADTLEGPVHITFLMSAFMRSLPLVAY